MAGEANVWNPRTLLQLSSDTKRIEERLTAGAGQSLFTLKDFTYVLNTGSLAVYKATAVDIALGDVGGKLLTKGIDWTEGTISTFSVVLPLKAGDQIVAVGYVAITADVDTRDTDIFVTNYQVIRDYVGTEITLYSQGELTGGDEGEAFFHKITGAAPGFFVDNGVDILRPTGGDGTIGWVRKEDRTRDVLTTSDMTTLKRLVAGVNVIKTKEFRTGAGTDSGGIYDIISGTGTANAQNIIAHATLSLSFVLRVDTYVKAAQFGIHHDGTNVAANDTILEALRVYLTSFTKGARPKLMFSKGNIAYSVSPIWGRNDITLTGAGSGATKFTYSGSARAFDIDPSGIDLSFRSGIYMAGFLIDCGVNGTHGMYEENIAHSTYNDVLIINGAAACIHWEQALCVLNSYRNCGSLIGRFPIASAPAEALRLAASPSKLAPTTACTYNNWFAEGATGTGIRLIDADVCTFTGGTAESNTGRGILIATSCRNNSFFGMDMEANIGQDFNDAGQGTIWDNCLVTSALGGIISGSSVLCKVRGGYYDDLKIESGAKGASVQDVNVNVNGTGGFSDLGTDSTKRNIYDKDAAVFLTPNKGNRTTITVTASPFTYTNTTTQLQQVLVRGGTVDPVEWGRDGDVVQFGGSAENMNANDQFLLSPGDTLKVTYSSAPTMNFIPMGVQSI